MNNNYDILTKLNNCLLHAADTHGLELLAFDEHGQCAYTLGESDTVLMYINDEGTTLTFATFMWDTLHQLTLPHAKKLLEWNYGGVLLTGMVIGICNEFDKVTMTYSIDTTAINETNFYSLLVNFSENAIDAKKQMADLLQADSSNTDMTHPSACGNSTDIAHMLSLRA